MGMILMTPHAPLQRVCIALSLRPKKHAAASETAPLLIALVMDKPRTARELSADGGVHISTVKRWLSAFEAAGVLTWDPSETECVGNSCQPVRVWRLHMRRAVS